MRTFKNVFICSTFKCGVSKTVETSKSKLNLKEYNIKIPPAPFRATPPKHMTKHCLTALPDNYCGLWADVNISC